MTPETTDKAWKYLFNGASAAMCLSMWFGFSSQLSHSEWVDEVQSDPDAFCDAYYDRNYSDLLERSADYSDKTVYMDECLDQAMRLPPASEISKVWDLNAMNAGISSLMLYTVWGLHRRRYPHLNKSNDHDNDHEL
ncbi:MAG: hypothetical protein ACRBDI_09220 [Alphaproteobacteria bacterium]